MKEYKDYKILKCETNLGRKFFIIKFRVTILYFIKYWDTLTYEDTDKPIEYKSKKDAKKDIEIMIKNERRSNEKIKIC